MDKSNSVTKGIFFIIVSAFGFSVMNLCVTLAGDLPTFQKALFRNAGALIVSFIMFLRSGDKLDTKVGDLGLLLLRATFGSIGLFANFYALDHMMISDASMLNKLAPFFTLILSALFLKEKTTIKQYMFVLIAFIGLLFIVKPSMEFTESLSASIIAIIGGIAAGAAYACVRGLGKRGMPSSQVVLGFSLVSTIVAIPFVIKDHAPMSLYQVIILSIAALGATFGQFGITWAYKCAPSKEISIFDYFTVIFSALWGFLFLSQVPDMYSVFGYLILFTSALLMFFYNKRH